MNREDIIRTLQLDEKLIHPCGGHDNCIHYGEGCALGYPLVSVLNGRGGSLELLQKADLAMLKRMYSPAFREYWRDRLRSRMITLPEDEMLPCAHQSLACSFKTCGHLDSTEFMSEGYKKQYASVDPRAN